MKFTKTHTRKPVKGRRGSKVFAQLLSRVAGLALYRVRFKQGKQTITRTTSTSEELFDRSFAEAV